MYIEQQRPNLFIVNFEKKKTKYFQYNIGKRLQLFKKKEYRNHAKHF